MTRPSCSDTYEEDFFAWTQEQAVALRAIPVGSQSPYLDIEHVAEEIEALGKRDLREVASLLSRLIEHLLKIDSRPTSADLSHWRAEALNFQMTAADAFSPSMRQALDLDTIWRKGRKLAQTFLAPLDCDVAAPPTCPFVLGELLADDFDLDAALARLGSNRDRR